MVKYASSIISEHNITSYCFLAMQGRTEPVDKENKPSILNYAN
jgi:hypothetical protein